MKQLVLSLAISLCLLCSGNAEWLYITTTVGDVDYYYNTEDIEHYSEYNRVWIKISKPYEDQNGVKEYVSRMDFHKAKWTHRSVVLYVYNVRGEEIHRSREATKWESFGPDSTIKAVWDKCVRL